jgi:intraflagellar transport protein 122
MLLEIVRKLDKADRGSLAKCAEHFKRMNMQNFAAEVYEKMGNIKELIELRMQSQQWDEMFALTKKYPDLNNLAHYKYGQWLAENDKFEEAQKAFNEAGFKKEAIKVLEELTFNSVIESRFYDASYYYWLLSMEHLQIASGNIFKILFIIIISSFLSANGSKSILHSHINNQILVGI